MATHRLFCVVELLEMILLQTDMRTLLSSCQRVCRAWNHLIKESNRLQIALFFKPSSEPVIPGQKRTQNPLLEHIWFRVWRPRIPPNLIRPYRKFPQPTAGEIAKCRRRGASWQKMLIYQPPTSHVGIIETMGTELFKRRPLYSEVIAKPYNDFLRLGLMTSLLWRPYQVRGRGEPLVCADCVDLYWDDRKVIAKCATAMAACLADCDIVVISRAWTSIRGPATEALSSSRSTMEFWVKIQDLKGVVEDRHRLEIFYQ